MILLLAAVIATVRIAGLNESSGLAASRENPGVFWTMNDGSEPILYAFDRTGKQRGRVRVTGAKAYDWEGLALGPGPICGRPYLYIGDIGDNRGKRKSITVYRIREPKLTDKVSERAEQLEFTYPDGPHDAEALLIHPQTGDLYIVIKTKEKVSAVYKTKAPLRSGRLSHISNVDLPDGSFLTMLVGRITDGSISPDGKRVVLCDYVRGWEALVPAKGGFDAVWKSRWRAVDLDARAQGEGIAYRHDSRAILATSEGAEFPLIEVNVSSGASVR